MHETIHKKDELLLREKEIKTLSWFLLKRSIIFIVLLLISIAFNVCLFYQNQLIAQELYTLTSVQTSTPNDETSQEHSTKNLQQWNNQEELDQTL